MATTSPYEMMVERLAKLLGEPSARSTVNTFCRQKVGVAPESLTRAQLNLVLPSFKPMLMILVGTTNAELVLASIAQELKS